MIVIYSTPNCKYCAFAKDWATTRAIPYKEIDVSLDSTKREEMIEVSGQMGVPVILVGDRVFVGFTEQIANSIVDELLRIEECHIG